MGLVFAFAGLSALAGAGKEVAIAWKYGVGSTVDAYQFVFNLSQWPLGIFASIFTVTLVPLVARLQTAEPGQIPRFQSANLRTGLWLAPPVCLLLAVALHFILSAAVLELEPSTRDIAGRLVLPMALSVGFGLIAVIAGGWILALNKHYNTLLQAIPAAVVALSIVWIGGGVGTLAWATVAGFSIYALGSAMVLRKISSRADVLPMLATDRLASGEQESVRSPHWNALLAGMGTLVVGQVLIGMMPLIDQLFAAQLGEGALSTLGYANRIVALVLSLVSLAINRGMLPVLSRLHVSDPARLRRVVLQFGLFVILAGVALAGAGTVLSDGLVSLLFERGQFSAQDTTVVSELVRYSMLQVPFYLVSLVAVSALLAQQRFAVVLQAAALNGLVKLALAYWLVEPLGLKGLLLATAAVYVVSAVYCSARLYFSPSESERVER